MLLEITSGSELLKALLKAINWYLQHHCTLMNRNCWWESEDVIHTMYSSRSQILSENISRHVFVYISLLFSFFALRIFTSVISIPKAADVSLALDTLFTYVIIRCVVLQLTINLMLLIVFKILRDNYVFIHLSFSVCYTFIFDYFVN